MNITIACIGSGNMGGALMKGAAEVAGGKNIGFTDADRPKAEALAKSLGAEVYDSNIAAVEKADYIFLAVKPQVVQAVLEEISPVLQKRLVAAHGVADKRPVVVSMAAGWSIAKIRNILSAPTRAGQIELSTFLEPLVHVPVVRIMPNTPALISQGVVAMATSPEVPAKKAAELEKLLAAAGIVDRMEEKYLDAVTGLSGSGPAFVYLFIEALADGGVRAGLPRDKALCFAAQTVLGSAAMVEKTGKHPGELKDMVTSPGGATIAGVTALENGAFRGTVINAVEAAWRRSTELG